MKYLPLILILGVLNACQSQDNDDGQQEVVKQPVEKTDKAENISNKKGTDIDVADGRSAPLKFSLSNLDGKQVKAEDYRGQWLFINYWATWCAPCRDEIPELVRFQNEYDNVQIIGIAYEDAPVDKLKNFAADFEINYPLLTMDIYNPPAFAAEGGLGLPTTIVYNPDGLRHKKHMGPIDYKGLQQLIE